MTTLTTASAAASKSAASQPGDSIEKTYLIDDFGDCTIPIIPLKTMTKVTTRNLTRCHF